VDGHLTGSVASDGGTLIVGTNGVVDANVSVASAMINGTVNGDIVATERLQLGRTAKVVGNIETPRLVLEDGAILEGGCSMIKARDAQESKASEPKSSSNSYSSSGASSSSSYSSYSSSSASSATADVDDEEEEEAAEAATL